MTHTPDQADRRASGENHFAFDRETAAVQVAPGRWQLTLASQWNINANPNGGYILACLVRAMGSLVPDHPDPLSTTTHYLRPGLPGALATLEADVVRQGRRTATVSGTLLQEGKPRIVSTATFGSLDVRGADTGRALLVPPPALPAPELCTARTALAQGVELPILSRVEVLIDPQYAVSGGADSATMSGWIRFCDGRPVDVAALPLFADAFPPSVFSLFGSIGWVPTVELAVQVRRRPQPGWIKARFNTVDLHGDLFIEDGMLWDEGDQLVAQCRQLQMLLSSGGK